jgi:rubrerythrin
METDHFINSGYGWVCKHCYPEVDAPASNDDNARARFHTEGEAEDKEATLSTHALARWRDASRRTLICPRCGIEEMVGKA